MSPHDDQQQAPQYPAAPGRADWQPPTPPVPGGPYPQRRRSWFARHKVLTGVGALVLVGGIATAATGGGGDTAPGSGSAEGTSRTQGAPAGAVAEGPAAAPAGEPAADGEAKKKENEQEKKGASIGQPVRDGKFEFTVTDVQSGRKQVGGEYLKEKAQGQFVLVRVKVSNTGDQTRALADTNQKLYDDAGRSYEADSMAGMVVEDDNKVLYEDINPGNSVTGVLVYDMPAGAKPARIELHDSMFSGGVTVRLR